MDYVIKAISDQYKILTLEKPVDLKCSPVFDVGKYRWTYLAGLPLCIGIERKR